jgi:hypothetical protein
MMKTGFKQEPNQLNRSPASIQKDKQPTAPGLVDNRNATALQRQLIEGIDNSPMITLQRQQLESTFGQPIQRAELEEEELLQGKFETVQRQGDLEEEELLQGKFETVQRQSLEEEEEPLQGKFSTAVSPTQLQEETTQSDNQTGMPDQLKAGVESLSGMDMSDVRVHYNSSKPAQLNALAYAQGNDIHLGAGQEQNLPHEAWHTVQQRQGRVKPTMQMAGETINDDVELEREADVMGERALQAKVGVKGSAPLFAVDNRPEVIAQRKLQAMIDQSARQQFEVRAGDGTKGIKHKNIQREIIQRKGTVNAKFMGGSVKLYIPEGGTTKAAYYCHGVYHEQMDVVTGVQLGYLAPHKSTTSANASAVSLAPNRSAETDNDGKWHSYILTKEASANADEVWLELAEESGRAIAWVQSPTTTSAIVTALKAAGYTDILAVHCREVMDEENVDWNPETNQEIVVEQEGWLIDRATMVGWRDSMWDALDDKSVLKKDEIFYDEAAKKSRKVLNPNEKGRVRICTHE